MAETTLVEAGQYKAEITFCVVTWQSVISSYALLLGDFRSWKSPQTLLALFIGSFEHVERFRNLKFAVIRITDIQSTVLSSSEA